MNNDDNDKQESQENEALVSSLIEKFISLTKIDE